MTGAPATGSLAELSAALDDNISKTYRQGTDRTVSPSETVRTVTPLMGRCGITRLANITGLDTIGIPVVVAIRPNGRSLSTSQGKGLTPDAAMASALMEAVELYHAESATLPLKFNSFAELTWSRHAMADVEQLPRSSARPLDPHQPLPWVESLNLLDKTTRWVPFELVHTNYTLPALLSSGMFTATSNGLASGNAFFEAVLHGMCEVVERDATTLFTLSSPDEQEARRLDLSTVDDGSCVELLRLLAHAGVATAVWETTTDIGLPCFLCTIVDRDEPTQGSIHAASGMGCHFDRRVALSRALTEAAQSRLTVTTGSRDDVPPTAYLRFQDRTVLRRVQNQVIGACGSLAFPAVATFEHETFAEDLDVLLSRLAAVGVSEVLVVNLGQKDLGVPVVRVIIPGLEGMVESKDYTPGRRAGGQS